MIKTKKSGFTLAEVLITLTIIGVVASLTLPNLNTQTTTAKNRAILKKTMSTIDQAIRQNYSINGWHLGHLDGKFTKRTLFRNMLQGEVYLGYVGYNKAPTSKQYNFTSYSYAWTAVGGSFSYSKYEAYALADGSIMGYAYNDGTGFIDVNGIKGPNKPITCSTGSLYTYFTYGESAFTKDCTIQENENADIFPIYFLNTSVVPGSNAAYQYLNGD